MPGIMTPSFPLAGWITEFWERSVFASDLTSARADFLPFFRGAGICIDPYDFSGI
jgi:hypothetical protein